MKKYSKEWWRKFKNGDLGTKIKLCANGKTANTPGLKRGTDEYRERNREYNRAWRERNRDKFNEYNRNYRATHPEIMRDIYRRRREKKDQ